MISLDTQKKCRLSRCDRRRLQLTQVGHHEMARHLNEGTDFFYEQVGVESIEP